MHTDRVLHAGLRVLTGSAADGAQARLHTDRVLPARAGTRASNSEQIARQMKGKELFIVKAMAHRNGI